MHCSAALHVLLRPPHPNPAATLTFLAVPCRQNRNSDATISLLATSSPSSSVALLAGRAVCDLPTSTSAFVAIRLQSPSCPSSCHHFCPSLNAAAISLCPLINSTEQEAPSHLTRCFRWCGYIQQLAVQLQSSGDWQTPAHSSKLHFCRFRDTGKGAERDRVPLIWYQIWALWSRRQQGQESTSGIPPSHRKQALPRRMLPPSTGLGPPRTASRRTAEGMKHGQP